MTGKLDELYEVEFADRYNTDQSEKMTLEEKVIKYNLISVEEDTTGEFTQEEIEKYEIAYIGWIGDNCLVFTKEGLDKVSGDKLDAMIRSVDK